MVLHFLAVEDLDCYSLLCNCVFGYWLVLTSDFIEGAAPEHFPHAVVTGLAHLHNYLMENEASLR